MEEKIRRLIPATRWLNKSVVLYAVRFGLVIAFAKAALIVGQQGNYQDIPGSMAVYFLISTLVAIPLFFYNQERKRSGAVMDRIILLCTGMIVLGGMLHDQIAVRVSIEYYNTGHFPIPGVHNTTLLALIWGFLGTWWFGAGLGMALAMAACAGERPPFPVRKIFQVTLLPLLGIECIAWLMATVGFYLTQQGIIGLEAGGYANLVPPARHAAFMADWWANGTAYCLLLVGAILLSRYIWKSRKEI